MARGSSPNSRRNLKRGNPDTQFTVENTVENREKGLATRRALKSFREIDAEDPATPQDRQEMLSFLKRMAKHNVHAFEVYRDTVGLKPKESVEVTQKASDPFDGLTTEELRAIIENGHHKQG